MCTRSQKESAKRNTYLIKKTVVYQQNKSTYPLIDKRIVCIAYMVYTPRKNYYKLIHRNAVYTQTVLFIRPLKRIVYIPSWQEIWYIPP